MNLRKLDFINSCLIITSGALQFAATPVFYKSMEEPAFWFFNGGITLLLLGSINVLRTKYTNRIPALRPLCIFANGIVLVFWLGMVYFLFYKFARYPFTFIEIAFFAAALLFSFRKLVE